MESVGATIYKMFPIKQGYSLIRRSVLYVSLLQSSYVMHSSCISEEWHFQKIWNTIMSSFHSPMIPTGF